MSTTTNKTEKLFTFAGTSWCNGDHKVRHATRASRIKELDKTGHTDIILIELPNAMTRVEAAEFIKAIPEFADELNQNTISDFIAKQSGNTEPKEPKKAKVEIKAATTQPADIRFAEKAEETVVETPAPELPKTKDTMTEEEWALLEQVSLAKA
jgi:hypothetical protein